MVLPTGRPTALIHAREAVEVIDTPLRIAQIAPVVLPIPPKGYGGIERVVALLTEELVARGHDITLFASGDSVTSATLCSVLDKAPGWQGRRVLADEMFHEAAAFLRAGDFDIVHDHCWFGAYFGAFAAGATPVVTTLHLPWGTDGRRSHALIGDRVHRVAVSHHQRAANPDVTWAGTIHHGIDLAAHPFQADKDDYLTFVGRTVAEKGPEFAVMAAQQAGRHLKMVVKRAEPQEREHWDRVVAPLLNGTEEIVDEPPHEVKVEIVGRSAGLLFPIRWDEPFGLVMVEAMACGTPVIAFDRGSVPEVVEHGVTGFVVSDLEAMVTAVTKLAGLAPTACRERVRQLFSVSAMASGYERLFRSLCRPG